MITFTVVAVGLLICLSMAARVMREPKRMALFVFIGLVASLAVFPRTLGLIGQHDPEHSGITTSVPLIATYHVAIVIAVIYLVLFDRFRIPIPHLLVLFCVPFLWYATWGTTVVQWAGYLHIAGAILAWGVGYSLARTLGIHKPSSTVWAFTISGVLIVQLAITLAQVSGVEFPALLTGTSRDVQERAFGTLANPANLSKAAFFLMVILLPLTTSKIRATRRWANAGVLAAIIVTGLTISRANMVAMGVMLLVWCLIVPGKLGVLQRLGALAAVGAAVWFFLGDFLARSLTDEADPRDDLMEAALTYLPDYFWFGLGLNSYVPVIGPQDPATAEGFPVHNAFLLAVMEMGVIVALLFFLPMIMLAFRTLRAVPQGRKGSIFLWALFSALPGYIAIMWTGWGVLSSFVLPLMFLILGVVDRQTSCRPLEKRRASISGIPQPAHAE